MYFMYFVLRYGSFMNPLVNFFDLSFLICKMG